MASSRTGGVQPSPGSEAYQRLSARIEAQTGELLDRTDEKEAADHRFREAMQAKHAQPDLHLSEVAQTRLGGLLFLLIGGGITVIGWAPGGSPWP